MRMQYLQKTVQINTSGRESIEITSYLKDIVESAQVKFGLCSVFIHHTSASLIVCENADPDVRADLESFISRLVPDGDPLFVHTCEGEDDMPAHVRSVLTQTEINIPISSGQLALGTWQGAYLWEHRYAGHCRKLTVTVHGMSD